MAVSAANSNDVHDMACAVDSHQLCFGRASQHSCICCQLKQPMPMRWDVQWMHTQQRRRCLPEWPCLLPIQTAPTKWHVLWSRTQRRRRCLRWRLRSAEEEDVSLSGCGPRRLISSASLSSFCSIRALLLRHSALHAVTSAD